MQSIAMKRTEWAGSDMCLTEADDFAADPARSIRGFRSLAALSLLFWIAIGALLLG